MSFGGYQLTTLLASGPDGVSYRAIAPDGQTLVEIRDLSPARSNPDRWPLLSRRLLLNALLDHPSALRLIESHTDQDPPFIVLETVNPLTLPSPQGKPLPLSLADALEIGLTLAEVLAEAHRLGLTHGRLAPSSLGISFQNQPLLDFTGINTDPSLQVPLTSDRPADIHGLATILVWLLTASTESEATKAALKTLPEPAFLLLRTMLSPHPDDRPTALEVAEHLARWADPSSDLDEPSIGMSSISAIPRAVPPAVAWSGLKLGRFRLLEELGVGGQGVVYRAEDTADGSIVAIKTLRPEWASRPEAASRFRKEARLLVEANNPHVVNLLEHGEDRGVPYLVMEFVTGRTLADLLEDRKRLDEPTALSVASNIALALEDAHRRGIVHRDVKPANILLPDTPAGAPPEPHPRVKLSDFGLARQVVNTESQFLTEPGALLGTPSYMSPEQCTARPVDPTTDVYSLGATLYHMLAGRPPFIAETREQLYQMHVHQPPAPLRHFNPEVSEGVSRVVDRALAKLPEDRYPDAAALRRDLERLARGEPSDILLHPLLPPCDPRRVQRFEFRWDLQSTPRRLWPLVSNTDRLDQALGFAPVNQIYRPVEARGVRQFVSGWKAGMPEAWEEHPYEWVEPHRMSVLREYTQGPFRWLISAVELIPRPGGGTTLIHRLTLEPEGWKSRVFSPLGVGVRFRADLGRIYTRIDASLAGKLGPQGSIDPFEHVPALNGPPRERLDRRLDALAAHGIEPPLIEHIDNLLSQSPAQELARLRPIALARRWGLDPEPVVAAFLQASHEGLLVLFWDILCPSCRASCEIADTLKAIREHGRCEACSLDFNLDFAESVELVFRSHPEIRPADAATYCVGGPAHAPHVIAQVRVPPGKRIELVLALPEGAYRLRGPQLPWSFPFHIHPGAPAERINIDLFSGPPPDCPRALRTRSQYLALSNTGAIDLLARVERDTPRVDALTAAQALAIALFRDLFPGEVLSPGQLVTLTTVTLLVTEVCNPVDLQESLGEVRAFAALHDHFLRLDSAVRLAHGVVVKVLDERIIAAFTEPEDAVRVALDLSDSLARSESPSPLRVRASIHRGPALVATIDGRLDYFGATPRRASRVLQQADRDDLLMTTEVAADPRVAAILQARGLACQILDAGPDGLLHRLVKSPQA